MPQGPGRFTELQHVVGGLKAPPVALVWAVARRYIVLARDLEDVSDLPADVDGFVCHGLDSVPAGKLMTLDRRLSLEEVERRQRDGQMCEIWQRDGAIVHFRWLADRRTPLPYIGLAFDPLPGDLLVDEVFTPGPARRQGIHSKAALLSTRRASAAGYRRQIALCAWWNSAALRVARKSGYQPVGSVTRWQLGLRTYHVASGAAAVQGHLLAVGKPNGLAGRE